MFWHFWTATYIIGMLEDTKVSILTLNYMRIDSGANNLKWEWLSTIWQHAWRHFWTVTYFISKVTVPNVSILKSQMCPSWPRKKGSGQDKALGESIEQVPKRHKCPLKHVSVMTNQDQKLYSCANRIWGQIGHILIVSKAPCPGERPETLLWHSFEMSILLSFNFYI